jgi:transcriptional regulator GlxA family with amidase domain
MPRSWASARRWLATSIAPRLAADPRGERTKLLCVCAGSLLAADAGLLHERQCTTHHEMLDDLQRLAPSAQVLANRVHVIDGPVCSSAGVLAGIDLALHLIDAHCGSAIAAAVAQSMVVYQRRGSDDPQLSPLLGGRNHLHAAVHHVQDAVCENPAAPWTLATLAELANVTPRHLARLFALQVGRSPREYVESIRVASAANAIARGVAPKQAISAAGFRGDRQWRRARLRVAQERSPLDASSY